MSVRHQPGGHLAGLRSERGSVTMLAAVGMALLLVVTVSIVSLAQLETKIGVNHAQEVQAAQAAEAGARRVFREIADGTQTAQQWINKTQPVRTGTVPGGSYSVTVVDNSGGTTDTDGLVAVQSTGTTGGGTTSAVTLLVGQPTYPNDAVRMNGYLSITNQLKVQGQCGSIHVPDAADTHSIDIDISNMPYVEQGISTSGSVADTTQYCKAVYPPTCPSTSPPKQTTTINAAAKPVPTIDPANYTQYTDFLLNSNGYAYSWGAGAQVPMTGSCAPRSATACGDPGAGWTQLLNADDGTTYAVGDCVKGWRFQDTPASNRPARWVACGTIVDGTYYVKGAATNATNYTTMTHTTLITEAYFDSSGSFQFDGDNAAGNGPNPTFPRDILLLSGTDIKLTAATSNLRGVIAAHEQIEISNVASLNGMLLAQNACEINSWPTCDGHITTDKLSNSSVITYNCNMMPAGLGNPGTIDKWLGKSS